MKKQEEKKKEQKKEETKKKEKGLWERVFNKRLEKTNKVAVIYLRENGNAEPKIVDSTKQGFFEINGKTYHERKDCTYTVGRERYPLAIIKEWSVIPEGTKDWEYREMQEKCSILQDHVMKGIRHAERVRMGESEGMKLNAKTAIGIAIAVIIILAVIMSYV